MKKHPTLTFCLCISITAGLLAPLHVSASGKTTDTTTSTSSGGSASSSGGSTSSGGTNSGGLKSGESTGTVSTAPTPIVSSNLTFSASGPINGVTPVCSGSYRIDPYYPTLSLMTVNLQAGSVDLVDGTFLYVTVFTSNNPYGNPTGYLTLIAGSGSSTISAYVSPATSVVGVVISDAYGNPLLVGN